MLQGIFDSVSPIEKIRLTREYGDVWTQSKTSTPIGKIKLIKRLNEIAAALEWVKGSTQTATPSSSGNTETEPKPAETTGLVRKSTAQFFQVRKSAAGRQKDNDRAVKLLKEFNADPDKVPTETDKQILAGFTGYGGGLIDKENNKKGSAYEYYTPKPVAEGVWDVLKDIGFAGGKILDPCSGTGIFGATSPENCVVDAVELSDQSGRIGQLINDGPGYKTTISNYEKIAAKTPDNIYDAVVTNVPFGETSARGPNRFDDPRYKDEPLEVYFILRSLEKLRPRGLAAFIVPMRCVSGKGGTPESLRQKASMIAEFVGAYRLPSGTFKGASTDTATDVIFFRKFSSDVATKIAELQEQNPGILAESKVIWDTFIGGKYFDSTEGQKYVLGDFVAKDPTKFRDVDKVISNAGLNDLREIMQKKKLPKSRIDWGLLESTETEPIVYQEGDTIYQAGTTLIFKNGQWEQQPSNDTDYEISDLLKKLDNPYAAFENKVTWKKVKSFFDFMNSRERYTEIPEWLSMTYSQITKLPQSKQNGLWNKAKIALSVKQVIEENSNTQGFSYVDEFEELSESLSKANIRVKDASSVGGELSHALKIATIHYSKKAFSAFWLGAIQEETKQTEIIENALNTPEGRIGKLIYDKKGAWLDIEDVKAILGKDFDPYADNRWCVSGDGEQVRTADDYYIGNYGEFLKNIEQQIEATNDQKLKDKLYSQKLAAIERVRVLDVSRYSFDLRCPDGLVSPQEKVEFLRAYNYEAYIKEKQISTGEAVDWKTPRGKLRSRIAHFINKGTITLGGIQAIPKKTSTAEDFNRAQAALLQELTEMIRTLNSQFNVWCRSNKFIMERLRNEASDPRKLRFSQLDDESDIAIPGMKPSLKLHGYQAAYVRRMGREFEGINGFGVGLGKTFTALAAVQHAQAIGAKRKTLFVVPNSVLANWSSEADKAYTTTEDCLFCGLTEDKNGQIKKASGDARKKQVWQILENKHAKIFMSEETFNSIRIKPETIEKYSEYLRKVDSSYQESLSKKDDENNLGRLEKLLQKFGKDNAYPFIEDMGIDSIVIDEAHHYKNGSEAVDFQGGKYLSLSAASMRGLDAMLKTWFIRGATPKGDGVLMLTATPITNSPLEIYGMLSLVKGQDRVNDSVLGCRGADDFLKSFCVLDEEDMETCDNVVRKMNVFTGLQNLDGLRHGLHDSVTVKNASDVGAKVVIPDRETTPVKVTLDDNTKNILQMMKLGYRYAAEKNKEEMHEGWGNPMVLHDPDYAKAYDELEETFREDRKVLGHPFNLINKMQAMTLDPDLAYRVTKYYTSNEPLAEKTDTEFNESGIVEEREKLSPYTAEDAILKTFVKSVQSDDGEKDDKEFYRIHIKAVYEEGGAIQVNGKEVGNKNGLDHITLDSVEPDTQDKFEKIADKNSLSFGVESSPKLAAFLENFKKEMSNPRGVVNGKKSPIVKQIVFCDFLGTHNKIKHLLSKRGGVPASKIAILTGQKNGTPEKIEEIGEQFNADGADNKIQVIIANKKAEVGINLQKGTQAIHHLTTGWTPDSIEQRNGRGARQGNQTEKVNIYFYDAEGTFDEAKRTMVNHKADWIGQVLDPNGAATVTLKGMLSREEQEALIESVGDAEAMRNMQQRLAEAEKRAITARALEDQTINIKTILTQNRFLKNYEKFDRVITDKVRDIAYAQENVRSIQKKIEKRADDGKPPSIRLNESLKGAQAELARLCSVFDKNFEAKSVDLMGVGIEEVMERQRFLSAASTASNFKPRENSPLYAKWQSDLESARSIIDQAKTAIKEKSSVEGSMSAEVAEMAEKGQLFFAENKLFSKDCVVVVEDDNSHFYCFVSSPDTLSMGYDEAGKRRYSSDIKDSNIEEVVLPTSPKYEQILQKLAAIDDASDEERPFYTRVLPRVLDYRKKFKTRIFAHDLEGDRRSTLPEPYFPFVIAKDWASKSELFKRIVNNQATAVDSSSIENGSLHWTTSQGFEVAESWRNDDHKEIETLFDYAKANKLPGWGQVFAPNTYPRPERLCDAFVRETLVRYEEKIENWKPANNLFDAPKTEIAKACINDCLAQVGFGLNITEAPMSDNEKQRLIEVTIKVLAEKGVLK